MFPSFFVCLLALTDMSALGLVDCVVVPVVVAAAAAVAVVGRGAVFFLKLELFHFVFALLFLCLSPQWGAADAEIKVPSGENTNLKRSSFTAMNFYFISPIPVHSPAFFPEPLPIFSCVGCG